MTLRGKLIVLGALLAVATSTSVTFAGGKGKKDTLLERGRYLAVIAGCNDCAYPLFLSCGCGTCGPCFALI